MTRSHRSPRRARRRSLLGAPLGALLAALAAVPLVTAPLAGQPVVPPLTLADALARARARHPALEAAAARRRAVVERARQDAALPNPVLELRRENMGSPLARDAFVTVAQPLDLTGRRFALRAEADALDRRAAADSAVVAREVEAAAARAFWRASLARALVALAGTQRADAERLAAFEADRAREGAVAELSAMRARVEAERARLAEAGARAELARATAELARATATPTDSLPLPAPLDPAMPSVAHRAAVDAAERRLAAERRGLLADVVAVAGTKQTAGYATHVLGLSVPLPLLDRNARGVAAATGTHALARAELRGAEAAVAAEVTAAVDGYRALLAARPAEGETLAARATEVARIAEAAYAAGGGSLLELLDARRARAETLAAVLRWVADLRLAHVELQRVLGAPPHDPLETP